MDIKFEKSEDALKGKITVEIKEADYAKQVQASLKKLKQKAQMPGFRKGMVPMSLIQKMYGLEVKAEEVEKLLRESVSKYINDEKIDVFGEPLNSDDNKNIDIERADDFTFVFDVALKPKVSVKIDGRTTVPYYNIQVDDKPVNAMIDGYRRQTGHNEEADTYSEGDMLKGTLKENVGEGEEGIQVEDESLLPNYFANDEQKALFKDAKKGDDIVFTPAKAYEGRENELASVLHVDKEEAKKHTGEFTFHVNSIDHFVMGEINEDLFNVAYPESGIKTEEEFRARVKSDIEDQYRQDSDYKFFLDLKDVVMKKVGEFPMAEDLLKKMAMLHVKDEQSMHYMEDHFKESLDSLRWSFVRLELIKNLGIKIDEAAIKDSAKRLIKMQMAQYGMLNIPENVLDNLAEERLKDMKQRDNIVDNAMNDAFVKKAKETVKLKEEDISIDDFNKMFEH